MRTYSKADLHNHSTVSDGYNEPEALVELTAAHTDIRVLAVTDHDNIEGGQRAYSYWKQHQQRFPQLSVVKGVEVSSAEGHILGLFIEQHIEPGQSAIATVAAIHAQGGIAIAAHPFTPMRYIFPEQGLTSLIKEDIGFDAIETRNSVPTELFANGQTERFNQKHLQLPEVGGSDSHDWRMIGKTHTRFLGTDAADLRAALLAGEVEAVGHIVSPLTVIPAIWRLGMAHLFHRKEHKGAARGFSKDHYKAEGSRAK